MVGIEFLFIHRRFMYIRAWIYQVDPYTCMYVDRIVIRTRGKTMA